MQNNNTSDKNTSQKINQNTIMAISVQSSNIFNYSEFKKANVSVFFTNKEIPLFTQKFLINMAHLDLVTFQVVFIYENEESIPEGRRYENIVNRGAPTRVLIIRHLSEKEFFSLNSFEYFFDDNKEKSFEYIFIFDHQNLQKIYEFFAASSITLSGGTNNRKFLLSPLSHRLSLFLICLYGGSESANQVKNSFHILHNKLGARGKKRGDYSTKESEKLVSDFINQNKEIKDIFRGESPLNKNNGNLENHGNTIIIPPQSEFHNEVEYTYSSNLNYDSKSQSQIPSISKDQQPSSPGQLPKDQKRKFYSSASILSLKGSKNLDKNPTPMNNSNQINEQPACVKHNQGNGKNNLPIIITNLPNAMEEKKKSEVSVGREVNPILLSYFMIDIKQIIDSAEGQTNEMRRQLQEKMEEKWITLINEKINDDEDFFINRYQGKLLSTLISVKKTLSAMEEKKYFKKKFTKLNSFTSLNNMEYILITFKIGITLYSRLSYNALALNIGNQILEHIYYKKHIASTSDNFEKNLKTAKDEFQKVVEMTEITQIFKLGDFYLSILQQFPHVIFNRKVKLDSFFTNDPFLLEINKEYLNDIKENLIIDPNTLPMICLPEKWDDHNFGGYLTNKINEKDIITGSENFYHIVENKTSVYQAVNYFNAIEFGINKMMLDYILSPQGSFLLESVKASDELQRALTLEVAKLYSHGKFYLNTHADFRGRIYTQSFYLSYQAGDLSLALLNFWEGQPINDEGKYYLYIYGANSHDENKISKASFKDRLNWVKKNYDKIINLDKELILAAESPFIFTAFCLNMREIHNNPNAIIKTPVFLDATCSGIQHLAGLMQDLELGINTNLLPQSEDDIPEDIYSRLLIIINKAINKFGEENIDYALLYWVALKRKHVKSPIMTKVYNITKLGMAKQLQALFKGQDIEIKEASNESFEEIRNELEENIKHNKRKESFTCPTKDGGNIRLTKREIYKIAEIINEQIFVVFPSLNNIYNYFIDVAKLTINLGIPLNWFAPSGIKITQNYQKKKKTVVSINLFGESKKVVLRENTFILDKNKQQQAIIPNIIHSLDASHLINLIKKADKDNLTPIITVHDCFGTLPNTMGNLEQRVKKEFIQLYSGNKFLKDFHQRLIQNINDNQYKIANKDGESYVLLDFKSLKIPTPPLPGDLVLENILKSKYMIC